MSQVGSFSRYDLRGVFMGLPKAKNRRRHPRFAVTGRFPGRFYEKLSGIPLVVFPVDISIQGLGLVCDSEIKAGSTVCYEDSDSTIELSVRWAARHDDAHAAAFRLGLQCVDTKQDLYQRFATAETLYFEDLL
jgi:hypothetical protein